MNRHDIARLLSISTESRGWAGNGVVAPYIHAIFAMTLHPDDALSLFQKPQPMTEFDYNCPAELFAMRRQLRRRLPFGYKRFAHASQAIRFAMEELPPECLVGAFLEVDERRYGSDDIRRLYEQAEYPLTRRGVRS